MVPVSAGEYRQQKENSNGNNQADRNSFFEGMIVCEASWQVQTELISPEDSRDKAAEGSGRSRSTSRGQGCRAQRLESKGRVTLRL